MSPSRKRLRRSLVRRRRQRSRTMRSPSSSWPMNVTRPSGRTPRVAGLPTSWRSAPSRIAWPRVSSSASGSAQHGAQRGRELPEHLLQPLLELDLVREHLHGVAVHVLVVVAALLHVVEVVELGSTARSSPSRSASSTPASAPARHDQPPQLAEQPLRRRLPTRRGAAARVSASVSASGAKLELGRQARQPERPQRVRLVGVRREDPQHTRVEVRAGRPPDRSPRRPPRASPWRSR